MFLKIKKAHSLVEFVGLFRLLAEAAPLTHRVLVEELPQTVRCTVVPPSTFCSMMATTGFLKERQSFFSLFGSEAGCFSECLEAVSGCANVTWTLLAVQVPGLPWIISPCTTILSPGLTK